MEVMTFGRHRGDQSCDVPLKYLVWAMATLGTPPDCVLNELRRRAGRHGTRDSIPAQAALSGFAVGRRTPPKKAKARKHHRPKTRQCGEVVGRLFSDSRRQWLQSGGDPSSCPWGPPEWPG